MAHALCSVVLDADGLAAFTHQHDALRTAPMPVVITPHAGELAMLMGLDRSEVLRDPVASARHAAATLQVIVVLKGGPTVIATPAGIAYVNPTGNAGMATAGSGDVLAGMIGALLAQRCSPLDAALCAVYLHGRAGDIAARMLTEAGVVAGDIVAVRQHIDRGREATFQAFQDRRKPIAGCSGTGLADTSAEREIACHGASSKKGGDGMWDLACPALDQ